MKQTVEYCPIGDCCVFIRNGVSLKQDHSSGGLPITRIETISNGKINIHKVGYAGINDETKYSEYRLLEGDILMSHINSLSHLGKSSIYLGQPETLIHGMNLLCLRPKKDLVDAKFLFYFTKSPYFKNQLPRIINKSVNQASFKVSDLKSKIKMPIPSLEEQKRIVKVLDEAYELCEKRKLTVGMLDDYLRSLFVEIFGDPIKNPKSWNKKSLSSFGEIVTGSTPPRNNKDNFSANYIEWIKTDNIVEGVTMVTEATEYLSEEGLNKSRFVTPGAVLIACIAGSSASIGRVAMTDRKVSFNQQINAIQPSEEINPLFLYWLIKLSKKYMLDHASKGMKKILTKGVLGKIDMIFPPISIQDQFAEIAEKTELIKQNMIIQLEELDTQFQGLMQKSFSS